MAVTWVAPVAVAAAGAELSPNDDEAAAAYAQAVAELRLALRSQLRIGNAIDDATWRDVTARLHVYEQAFANAPSSRARREIAGATAAYLGEALAQQRTDELIARGAW